MTSQKKTRLECTEHVRLGAPVVHRGTPADSIDDHGSPGGLVRGEAWSWKLESGDLAPGIRVTGVGFYRGCAGLALES